ncbi:MAG TPA: hypothetical protein DCW50_11695 [Gammaproteobacteria bacterium]|nr:hypothetical protein [Gammaproteobacteria bacterium]
MMQALSAHQCKPMIRATSGDPAVIKRVLNIGPLGMMVPNVASVREARDVVAACRYGPDGFRGAAPCIAAGNRLRPARHRLRAMDGRGVFADHSD